MSIVAHPVVAAFLQRHSNHPSGPRPLAVFDCDGTVIRGDMGEAMFYHQIEHFLFRRSPASVWPDHSRRDELDDLYQRLSALPPAERTASPDFTPFAASLLSWYFGQIAYGAVAKACADIVRLLAGHTPITVRAIADATFADELTAPLSTRLLGGRPLPRGIRFLREAIELIAGLQERGFDIRAVSGSNLWSVEPVFRTFGIPPEKVVGLELAVRDGVLTPEVIEPVPIREGKVPALRRHTNVIPALVASDSKNDIPLFLYSSGLKIRINSRSRDTADFFRAANTSPDESWVLIESPGVIE